MKLRLQADNDLDQRIVLATRRLESAIDFQTAGAVDLHGLTDEQVLGLAAQQSRIPLRSDFTVPGRAAHCAKCEESRLVAVTRPRHRKCGEEGTQLREGFLTRRAGRDAL